MATGKSVLLVITGSIAAYKSLELMRGLKEQGVSVTCVLTKAAEQFVTPLTCASVSGNKVYTDLFSLTDETEMGHIELSRKNDLIVVAPATADILAKMAHGFADDLASTLLLATDKPVLVAPAMNVRMWEHPTTRRNVEQVRQDGAFFVGPEKGEMACGEYGMGRMAEPEQIVPEILRYYEYNRLGRPLAGMKALVTSGPTMEAIDPVRYIANRSSGKQGHAIAESLKRLGAEVTLVTGPTHITDPVGVKVMKVESARQMLEACYKALPCDVAICAAAVSDWRSSNVLEQKIKKSGGAEDLTFTFMENPDILECLAKHQGSRPKLVVGFAAETEALIINARAKLEKKGCDWILANDVSGGSVFGKDETSIHFITNDTVEDWPEMNKKDVATRLAVKVAEHFEENAGTPQPKIKSVRTA